MKNILTIILIISASLNLKAQGQFSSGNYLSQPDLNKFAGKWAYADDTIKFTINLRNEKVHVKRGTDDFYIDLIQGDYTLEKHGKVIQSSIGKDAAIVSGGFIDKKSSLTKIQFLFTDLDRKSNRGSVIFELLDNSNKASWILTNTEHIVVGNEHYDPSFSVPRKMVLTRVK